MTYRATSGDQASLMSADCDRTVPLDRGQAIAERAQRLRSAADRLDVAALATEELPVCARRDRARNPCTFLLLNRANRAEVFDA